jgi:hypothetical protein
MNQALAVREASITVPDKVFRTTEGILTFIGQFTILTFTRRREWEGGPEPAHPGIIPWISW